MMRVKGPRDYEQVVWIYVSVCYENRVQISYARHVSVEYKIYIMTQHAQLV